MLAGTALALAALAWPSLLSLPYLLTLAGAVLLWSAAASGPAGSQSMRVLQTYAGDLSKTWSQQVKYVWLLDCQKTAWPACMPCPALPCPALSCPALRCTMLPCPSCGSCLHPLHSLCIRHQGSASWQYSSIFFTCFEVPTLVHMRAAHGAACVQAFTFSCCISGRLT